MMTIHYEGDFSHLCLGTFLGCKAHTGEEGAGGAAPKCQGYAGTTGETFNQGGLFSLLC